MKDSDSDLPSSWAAPAKIDEKCRLKLPAGFRKILEERYGRTVSPLDVW